MKYPAFKNHALSGVLSLLLAGGGLASAQVPITNIINTFDTAPSSGNGIGHEWGPGNATWDSATGNPAGAELITATFDPSSDTPLVAFACEPGGNPWYVQTPINFSAYTNLEFDILWDNTSDITIDEFNDVSTWPLSLTNSASANQSVFQSWASQGQLAAGGVTGGVEITLCGGPGGQSAPTIIVTNIPAAASNGWVHMGIKINQAQSQIDGVSGIVFHKWCANTWTLVTPVNARFWIDNVELKGTTLPPPPPKLSNPIKAVQGLNTFSSTEGNSYYDRQEAELMQSSGLSWVGQATTANPVTYTFTVAGYPNSVNCEAYLFLVPNPAGNDSAPDWNETNCAIFYLQGSKASAVARFQYKVNEDHQNAMYGGNTESRGTYTNTPGTWDGHTTPYLESGSLATMTAPSGILGTWTLKFTSDTNGTIIAPDGTSTNFIIPPYNIGYFAETASPAFNVYLGMQANNADAMNQAVVFSNFGVSGTASPFSENFLADTVLDTTNVWRTTVATGPAGVLIVPTNEEYWIEWTLPDSGFSLQTAPVLNNPLAWTTPSQGPIVPLYGLRAQLVASNEVPAGPTAFFECIQRVGTQLQVLFPGETNAPNTPTGKIGTPQTGLSGIAGVPVTINMVDATFHIVNSSDNITETSSDSGAVFYNGKPQLANGTATDTAYFSGAGSFTVTATDTSNTSILSGTSSTITVGQ